MKYITLVLLSTLCACQIETDTQDTKTSSSPTPHQEIKNLEISSHQDGHVQWKLKAQELLSDRFEHSQLKNLHWTSQTHQLKISMEKAQQPEKQVFTSDEGHLWNASFHLQASDLQLNLKQRKLTGKSAQLKHFQGDFDLKDFQLDLETQQLSGRQVHAIIKRSSP